jgi:hypothetical protein
VIPADELVTGALLLAATTGSCLLAGWWLVRGRWQGAPLVLAFGTVASALVIGAHLVPGMLGVLSPWTALLCALALLAAARRWTRRDHSPSPRPRFGAGWPALIAVAACAFAYLREHAGLVVTGLDATSFHIPLDARFIQTGSVWGLHQWLPDYSNATYPANGNLLQVAAILPFEHAFLATLVAVPFYVMAGVAAYAIGRELGAGPPASALAGAVLLAVADLARVSFGTAVTDAPTLAFLGAGMVFGLRGETRMAALALGLAAGTKWYGLSYAAVLVLLWLVATRRWRALPAAVGIGALAGGFWFVRNWVETGNPVFPLDVFPFSAPPDVIREQAGFTIFDYLTDWAVWDRYLLPAFEAGFGWPGAALAAAALATAGLARRGAPLAVVVAAAGLAAAYFATPYSAFGAEGQPVLAGASTRYGLPALLAAAGAAAWLLERGGWLLRALAFAAVLLGLRRAFPGFGAAELLVGALLAGAAYSLLRAPRLVLVPVAGLALFILAGRAEDSDYTSYSPLFAERQGRMGLAGQFPLAAVSPVLPAFGERLRNDVDYLGSFEDGYLRRHREPAAFLDDLRDRDYLFVGCAGPCPEREWAQSAGWEPAGEDGELVLLRYRRPGG